MIIEPAAMPPCIRSISGDLAAGKNVGHRARLAYASFMLKMEIAPDAVAQAFSKTPNHDANKTRHIVADLAAKGHMPQSCSTMKSDGLCKSGMPEEMCSRIRNPLSWGRIRTGTVRGVADKPAEEPLVVAVCQCRFENRVALPRKLADERMNTHYWSVPAAEESGHLAIEYRSVA